MGPKEVIEKLELIEKSISTLQTEVNTVKETTDSVKNAEELSNQLTEIQKSVEGMSSLKGEVDSLKEQMATITKSTEEEPKPEEVADQLKTLQEDINKMKETFGSQFDEVGERITKISKSTGINETPPDPGENDEYKPKYKVDPYGSGK